MWGRGSARRSAPTRKKSSKTTHPTANTIRGIMMARRRTMKKVRMKLKMKMDFLIVVANLVERLVTVMMCVDRLAKL